MTVTIATKFPLGRYHATPWGRAVNEAAVEWPPSPWRLLRALYATWKWRLPDLPASEIEGVLRALSDAPSFRVPRYTEAHSRHYMPDTAEGKDKVLDAFAVLDPSSEVLIRWPAADVSRDKRTVLESLCDSVSYLGRAESISSVRLVDDDGAVPNDGKWLHPGSPEGLGSVATRVLVPIAPLDLSALVVRTTDVRKGGRITPPGARWVSYPGVVPESRPIPRARMRQTRQVNRPTGVLLRFDAAVLPSVRDTVSYGQALRNAVMKKANDNEELVAFLSGKDSNDGRRLLDGHRHPHFLPFDADEDGLIDSAVVWCPDYGGLDDRALEAILGVRKLWSGMPGFRPVRVFAESYGPVESLVPKLCKKSSRWKSVTPFAPYRHQKKESAEDFLRKEIDRELETRRIGVSVASFKPLRADWLSYTRRRRREERQQPAWGIEIELSEAVSGPLVLGGLSHFGLGLLEPG